MTNTAKDLLKDPVYLIDGSSYIFRAYYAVSPSLTTSDGFPTNALFGFTRMILKLIQEAASNHIIMVFDAGQKTFRNDLYAEYKANRDECPADLREQMPYFRDISRALGLPLLELPGYEADDIIGTLVARLEQFEHEVVIVSGDKDLMQLVGPHVSIWDTMRDRKFREAEVKEKMGVPPEKVIDFLGLTGDSSDNIPGLKGVGPKTAVQLIEEYGSIENILASADAIKENKAIRSRKKISEQIEQQADIVALSKKLVTIDCACPVQIESDGILTEVQNLDELELVRSLTRKSPDNDTLNQLIEKLEFSSLFKNLDLTSREKVTLDGDYMTVMKADFNGFISELLKQQEFSFDLETTSLDVLKAEIVGLAFCWSEDKAYYIPVGHENVEDQVLLTEVLSAIKPVLIDPAIKKVGQNLKFDIGVLARYEIRLEGLGFDTMLASYLLNPDKNSHSLSVLAQEELGIVMSDFKDVVGDRETFAQVEVGAATNYAAEDAHVAWLLYRLYIETIRKHELDKVMYEIELPLVSILSEMERTGILLDTDFLKSYSVDLTQRLAQVQAKLYTEAGCEFNINSPKQLS
ncbi:MAG: hypothetical protein KDD62_10835, partial [Bdellovibrionales bacterium]|nr:hypothetical protein [Bdellovibrionales bacterium]